MNKFKSELLKYRDMVDDNFQKEKYLMLQEYIKELKSLLYNPLKSDWIFKFSDEKVRVKRKQVNHWIDELKSQSNQLVNKATMICLIKRKDCKNPTDVYSYKVYIEPSLAVEDGRNFSFKSLNQYGEVLISLPYTPNFEDPYNDTNLFDKIKSIDLYEKPNKFISFR